MDKQYKQHSCAFAQHLTANILASNILEKESTFLPDLTSCSFFSPHISTCAFFFDMNEKDEEGERKKGGLYCSRLERQGKKGAIFVTNVHTFTRAWEMVLRANESTMLCRVLC
jgi:hypothetical protein